MEIVLIGFSADDADAITHQFRKVKVINPVRRLDNETTLIGNLEGGLLEVVVVLLNDDPELAERTRKLQSHAALQHIPLVLVRSAPAAGRHSDTPVNLPCITRPLIAERLIRGIAAIGLSWSLVERPDAR